MAGPTDLLLPSRALSAQENCPCKRWGSPPLPSLPPQAGPLPKHNPAWVSSDIEFNILDFKKGMSLKWTLLQEREWSRVGQRQKSNYDVAKDRPQLTPEQMLPELGQDNKIFIPRIKQSSDMSCTGKGQDLREGGFLQLRQPCRDRQPKGVCQLHLQLLRKWPQSNPCTAWVACMVWLCDLFPDLENDDNSVCLIRTHIRDVTFTCTISLNPTRILRR